MQIASWQSSRALWLPLSCWARMSPQFKTLEYTLGAHAGDDAFDLGNRVISFVPDVHNLTRTGAASTQQLLRLANVIGSQGKVTARFYNEDGRLIASAGPDPFRPQPNGKRGSRRSFSAYWRPARRRRVLWPPRGSRPSRCFSARPSSRFPPERRAPTASSLPSSTGRTRRPASTTLSSAWEWRCPSSSPWRWPSSQSAFSSCAARPAHRGGRSIISPISTS